MPEEQVKKSIKLNPLHTISYTLLIALLAASAYFNYESFFSSKAQSDCTPIQKSYTKLQKDFNEAIVTIQKLNEEKAAQATPKVAQVEQEAQEEMAAVQEEVVEEKVPEPMPTTIGVKMVKDFTKCYDMGQGIYEVSKKCRKDIIAYVDRHQDAKYFEIIGIVDRFEFKLFSLFDKDPSLYEGIGTNKKAVDKIRKYTQFGLAKYRASEASWVIKSHTKQKAHTYNANYHLVSQKDYKGVVIRAYK